MPPPFPLSAAVPVECDADCTEPGARPPARLALFQSNSFNFRWAAGGAAPSGGKMASKLTLLMIKNRNRSSNVTRLGIEKSPCVDRFCLYIWIDCLCRYFSIYRRIHVNARMLTYHFVSFDHLPRCQLSVVCRVDQWHKTIWKNTDFVEPKI